ncbi:MULTISPECIES: DUF6059 family protein [Thermomonosporaceae]|uniref:DUF6059 family protein n=1 Tax=Thermomonosporaceae TaxID=2012 RepID=UPI00255A7996|nr:MULTISPECIES: DUF6059 family protein [Thermomonosporaceae]MDL4774143.1 hypothetical protein [Actinomadura xylanilytica]
MGSGLLRRVLRYVLIGLGHAGLGTLGMTPSQYMRYIAEYEADAGARSGDGPSTPSLPPPAHPERLVPGEPLGEEASGLWAQLDDLGR